MYDLFMHKNDLAENAAPSPSPGGPLAGVRVLDLTSVLMGPFASQNLGDMGADVIKIEAPQGDLVRQIGPARHDGRSPGRHSSAADA